MTTEKERLLEAKLMITMKKALFFENGLTPQSQLSLQGTFDV